MRRKYCKIPTGISFEADILAWVSDSLFATKELLDDRGKRVAR